LTIKLTQHVSLLHRRESRIARERCLLQSTVVWFPDSALRQARLSTMRYLSKNLRFTPSTSLLQSGGRNCLLPQLSKNHVPGNSYRLKHLRVQRSAWPVWSRHASNKKPGVKRRVSPSTPHHSRQGDGVTRSSTFLYPEFVTNLTSTEQGRLRAVSGLEAQTTAR